MINFDYLLAAFWLIALLLFITPMAIAESIAERRKYARHCKRFYRVYET